MKNLCALLVLFSSFSYSNDRDDLIASQFPHAIEAFVVEAGERTKGMTITDNLQQQLREIEQKVGTPQVGEINLQDIRNQLSQVKWLYNKEHVPASKGNRFGAIHFTEEKLVVINQKALLVGSTDQSAVLLYHELFGVLGYDDENYSLSTSLRGLETNPTMSNFLLPSFQGIKHKSNNRQYKREGGGTGVGGGGDPFAAEIKNILMQVLIRAKELSRSIFEMEPEKYLPIVNELEVIIQYHNFSNKRLTTSRFDEKANQLIMPERLWYRLRDNTSLSVMEVKKYFYSLHKIIKVREQEK